MISDEAFIREKWMNMRRVILIAMAWIMAAAGLMAETPIFGVKGAIDVPMPGKFHNSAGTIKMYNPGHGFSLGGVCNVFLGQGFYFEPGVSLFYEGYGYNDLLVTNANGEVVDCDPKLWKAGLRVPVVFGCTMDITDNLALTIFTGPELNYAFAGKNTYKHKDLAEALPTNLFQYMRRVDLAWHAGFGVPISGFLVSLEASFGLTDLIKNPNISYRENRISGSLTYYF